MSDDDELLRALGAIAREREETRVVNPGDRAAGEQLATGRYPLSSLIAPAEGRPADAGVVEGALAAGVVREATPSYGIQILE